MYNENRFAPFVKHEFDLTKGPALSKVELLLNIDPSLVAGIPMLAPLVPRLLDPCPDSLAADLALELREDRHHRRHGAAGRRGQVERLGEGHEGDAELLEFSESAHQVAERTAPAIQPPHRDDVYFAPPRSVK